jgi:pSer/pThr/pTyr-binding forkhead associated (FHA) protein
MSGVIVLSLRLILAACLYAFLGWALYILWKELQIKSIELVTRKMPSLNLTIQNEGTKSTHRVFHQSDIFAGRDSTCDVFLDDDAVSARHFHMGYHHGQWWLEDLNSTNGTWLNQVLIATPTVITTGDQIECGHTAIVINIGATANPSPTTRL